MASPDFTVTAADEDLAIDVGATFIKTWTWEVQSDPLDPDTAEPVDLTGCTARAKFRVQEDPSYDVIISLTDSLNGGITLGGVLGTVTIEISPAQSIAARDANAKSLFYDLEIEFTTAPNAGRVKRLVAGVAHFDWGTTS